MSSLKKMMMFGFLAGWGEGTDADEANAAGSAAETIPVAAPSKKRKGRMRVLFIGVRAKCEAARTSLQSSSIRAWTSLSSLSWGNGAIRVTRTEGTAIRRTAMKKLR